MLFPRRVLPLHAEIQHRYNRIRFASPESPLFSYSVACFQRQSCKIRLSRDRKIVEKALLLTNDWKMLRLRRLFAVAL